MTPGTAGMEALALATQGQRQCALGFHAWVPWLPVPFPDEVGGGIDFYTTWCAREGCDHTEQWDCP